MDAQLIKDCEQKALSWLNSPYYDDETKAEIKAMLENEDENPLVDAFYQSLEFGTGGLRGIMGAGTNRMNKYIVGMATQGFANYINKAFPNGGKILVHELVSSDDSDYEKLIEVATFFAAAGKEVRLTPKMKRPPQFEYVSIYGSLVGTQYEHKCPDLLVDDLWYEHEGFITDNAKRAFGNMMNHGLKQSSRLIIDKPDLTDGFMIRSFYGRIKQGAAIDEVWLRNPDGTFKLLFKNDKHLP